MRIFVPRPHSAPPGQFAGKLGKIRSDRWQRMETGLYLLARSRRNLVQELAALFALADPEAQHSSSLREVFYSYLWEAGLVDREVLPFFLSGLSVVRLTDLGKQVCWALGFEPQESEWERLIRLHSGIEYAQHSAMLLAFAREARLRDYKVFVCPERREGWPLDFAPDAFVIDSLRRRAFVEVERSRSEQSGKWKLQKLVQNFAAVVTLTAASRSHMVERILAQNVPVWATDLETLRRKTLAEIPGPLWIERWRSPQEKTWSWDSVGSAAEL